MQRKKLDLAALAEMQEVRDAYDEAMAIAGAALRRGSAVLDATGSAKATVTITIAMTHDRGKERTTADVRVVAKTSPPDPIDLDLALPYDSDDVLVDAGDARQLKLGEADDPNGLAGVEKITMTGGGRSVTVTGEQAAKALRKLGQ